MKNINVILKILFLFTVVLFSCEKEAEVIPESNEKDSDLLKCGSYNGGYNYSYNKCGDVELFDFYSAANVEISNNSKFITVKITTLDQWLITRAYLYLGLEENIPLDEDSIPDKYQFPYSQTFDDDAYPNTISFEVPIDENWNGCIKFILKMKIVTLDEDGMPVNSIWTWLIDENENYNLEYCIEECTIIYPKPYNYYNKWNKYFWWQSWHYKK